MGEILVGFGTHDITPQVGVELMGFGWYLERRSTGIIEPLFARAMVWQSGDHIGAIISCDLIGVERDMVLDIRRRICTQTGIPPESVLICATHTHSGPATVDLIAWGEKDFKYLSELPEKVVGAVKTAIKNMQVAEFEYAEIDVQGISYNREDRKGITDGILKLLKVSNNRKLMGFFAAYACHPVVMCEQTSLISGDFIGLAMNKVGLARDATGLFLQGACGDQNSVYCHKPQEESVDNLNELSALFSGFIETAIDVADPINIDKISARHKEITLPQVTVDKHMVLRMLKLLDDLTKDIDSLPQTAAKRIRFEKAVFNALSERYENQRKDEMVMEIQAFRFGELIIAAHPSELFYYFQRKIEEHFKPLKTIVVGYANDYKGYVPSADKYDLSEAKYSYAAYFVPLLLGEFPFREDAGEILTKEIIELVSELMKQ